MARADKATAVAELTEAFRSSAAAVLTEYRGLTVAELKQLRRSLAGNATYSVVKNTLTKIAAREAGIDSFESLLEGPSAIAFVSGDPVEVAKGLRSFGREHPRLIVKGGILDGKPLTADEIRRLADLESREALLARFAGGLLAPAQQFASVLAAPVAQLARLLGALEAKAAADPDTARGGDGASATDPQPEPIESDAATTDSVTDTAATEEAPAVAEPGTPEAVAETEADQTETEADPTDSAEDQTETESNPTDTLEDQTDTTTDGGADASAEG
jgi:large subunit ribosomal protein L10